MRLDDRSSMIILAVVTVSLALAVGLIIPLASGARPGGTPPPWTPLPSLTPTPPSPIPTRLPFIPSKPQTPTPKLPTPSPTGTATAMLTVAPASPTPVPTRIAPTPQATKTATAAPSRTPDASVTLAQISAGPLNLRAGPGTDRDVLGTGRVGEVFTVTARSADGAWLEVCCVGNKSVWLSSPLVTITGTVASLPVKP